MKRIFLVIMVLAISLAMVTIAFGVGPTKNTKNTKHNLSTSGTGSYKSTNEDQICVFCHTPHQSMTSADPLWNHSLSTTASYGVYSSSTMNATPTNLGVGTTYSNLCLSCHDGTVAVNSLYNPSNDLGANPGWTGSALITTTANIGTDLSNDHPVNFSYNATLVSADGELAATTATVPGYGGKTIAQVLTPGDSLQCSSCHEPHIDYSGAQTGYAPFLRVNNVGSQLCLTCHLK